jgi:hypothetical protein
VRVTETRVGIGIRMSILIWVGVREFCVCVGDV